MRTDQSRICAKCLYRESYLAGRTKTNGFVLYGVTDYSIQGTKYRLVLFGLSVVCLITDVAFALVSD